MSRTDELRGKGARDRTGSGGGSPFVRWAEDYAWVEGTVKSIWQTQFGPAVEMEVTNCSPNVETAGKDEDGASFQGKVKVGETVNVGLNNKMLEGSITTDDVGRDFHVAFEGWQNPQKHGANRYRVFTVLDITREHEAPKRSAEGIEPWPEDEEVEERAAVQADDDSMPF